MAIEIKTHPHRIVECANLNREHIENRGEDANPICCFGEITANYGFTGVFDGMGGAGSRVHELANGELHTEAYLASRFVREVINDLIDDIDFVENFDSEQIESEIKLRLKSYKEELGIKACGLRSSMVKTLPTTLAMTSWYSTNGEITINSFWAGDSRNYILFEDGLKMLSLDHVRGERDAMTTLHDDPPMYNCVSEDTDFFIDKKTIKTAEPFVLISCTDGCFGYLQNPIHFEQMLAYTMLLSNTIDEWRDNLDKYLSPISGDDYSFAIQVVGCSFNDFKMKLCSEKHYVVLDKEHSEGNLEMSLNDADLSWEKYAPKLEEYFKEELSKPQKACQ